MAFHNRLTKSVKLAVRQRLELILAEEEKSFAHFKNHVKPRLKGTRGIQVQRAFNKRIQAYRIVIYTLTPYDKRTTDVPLLFERKTRHNVETLPGDKP